MQLGLKLFISWWQGDWGWHFFFPFSSLPYAFPLVYHLTAIIPCKHIDRINRAAISHAMCDELEDPVQKQGMVLNFVQELLKKDG